MRLHENSPKRIILPGAVYYIVSKTMNNYPYFKERVFCDLFIEGLKFCKELKGFILYGFSIIYDHVNLLIEPSKEFNISQVTKSLKENFSRNINVIMGYTNQVLPRSVGDTTSCHQPGTGQMERRLFILSMHKCNTNSIKVFKKFDINYYKNEFKRRYHKESPYPKFQWAKSFFDHRIRFHDNHLKKQKDWDYHYDYTVYNHLKHGLLEDWQYTSFNFSELIDRIES